MKPTVEADFPYLKAITQGIIDGKKIIIVAGAGISTSSGIPVRRIHPLH